jgi:hypothetical protein
MLSTGMMPLRSRILFLSILFAPLCAYAAEIPQTFYGYITATEAPNEFDIGDKPILCGEYTAFTKKYSDQEVKLSCDVRQLPIGSRVQTVAVYKENLGKLVATEVTLFPDVSREGEPIEVTGTGLIQVTPQLQNQSSGRAATLWVDGYPLEITPETKLLAADGGPFAAEKVSTNLWASYTARRKADEPIIASEIWFAPNTVDAEEQKFRAGTEPKITEPDYAKNTPGKIGKWKIIPEKSVQDYVTRVGNSLIPQYQKDLPPSDPTKISFRFYVIEHPSVWRAVLPAVCSTANGVIVIQDRSLARLRNEAQLAALLANSIALVLEKQEFRHRKRIKTQKDVQAISVLSGFFGAPVAIGNGISMYEFFLHLKEQSTRIGLGYMLSAGYDIRETLPAWAITDNRSFENPMHQYEEAPQFFRLLLDDLRMDYSATDYAKLKTNLDAYQQMLVQLRRVSPKVPKPTGL